MTAKRGKILINFDPVLAHRVQRELFAQGFEFASNPQEYRPGEDMYGLVFTTEYRTVTVNRQPTRVVTKLIAWTSNKQVFKYYSAPQLNSDFTPKPAQRERQPELIEFM